MKSWRGVKNFRSLYEILKNSRRNSLFIFVFNFRSLYEIRRRSFPICFARKPELISVLSMRFQKAVKPHQDIRIVRKNFRSLYEIPM